MMEWGQEDFPKTTLFYTTPVSLGQKNFIATAWEVHVPPRNFFANGKRGTAHGHKVMTPSTMGSGKHFVTALWVAAMPMAALNPADRWTVSYPMGYNYAMANWGNIGNDGAFWGTGEYEPALTMLHDAVYGTH